MKRLLCFLFGHKNPLGKDKSAMRFLSAKADRFYYAMKIIPCNRCGGYLKFAKLSDEEALREFGFVESYDLPSPNDIVH